MAYLHRAYYLFALAAALLLTACSTLGDMPEDELLYRGIKQVDYDRWHSSRGADSVGVITAIADAVDAVGDVLSGASHDLTIVTPQQAKAQADSLRRLDSRDLEHYNQARSEVEAVLSYAPNGSLMGSSYHTHPFLLGLWIYNRYVGSTSRFGRWMFNRFAQNPVYLSTVNPKVRTNVARTALRNHGYFRARVGYDTVAARRPRMARLSYYVQPGPLFHLDSITYHHFPHAADSVIHATSNATLLRTGVPFKASTLDAERSRIATELQNKGYFYYRPEYMKFKADTLQHPLHVQLQVHPDPATPPEALRPLYIGHTTVRVLRHGDSQTTDTLPSRGGFTFAYSGHKAKPLMKPDVLRRMMFYRPGTLYSQRLHELWQQKMMESGQFAQVKAEYHLRDTTVTCDTLDMVVTAVLDRPYDAKLEGRVTGKSNGQIGPGLSYSLTKGNAFRGGETLGFDVYGSYEWQTGANVQGERSLLNSYQLGTSLHLTYPRTLFFGLGRRIAGRHAITSTQVLLDARCQNRANYFGRVTFGARLTYSFLRKRNVKHEFTPLRLDYEVLFHSTQRFDSIVNANPSLSTSMRNQFVPSMEYTYSWQNRGDARRSLVLNVKEASAVTSAIYALAGKPFDQRDKHLFGVPFAQYVKATAQYTHAFKLTPNSCIATRAFVGAIYSYGNATSASYSDLFTIGGANSIRAFAMRSIGPGAYHPADGKYSYITQTGDLKFEVNAEYRFPIVGNLYGATFIDAGNVWTLRDNPTLAGGRFTPSRLAEDLALGTGVGLRYDLDFLVLRFDLGIGIHAPYDTGRTGYYNMPTFARSLGYHLAIGYPF